MNKEEYGDFRAEMEYSKSKERFLKENPKIKAKIIKEERYYRELNQRIDRQLNKKWQTQD